MGEGGDETSAIDEAAERAVVARLDAGGGDFTLVSEELGIRPAREGSATYVVVDPIDGSINAKRGIPFFSLSIAVADGPTMGDVQFGFVHDFGSGEEWFAYRGEGGVAERRGRALRSSARADRAAVDGGDEDGSRSPSTRPRSHPSRTGVRVMGSLALSLCHLASRPRRRGLLAQAGALGRHRRRCS